MKIEEDPRMEEIDAVEQMITDFEGSVQDALVDALEGESEMIVLDSGMSIEGLPWINIVIQKLPE